MPKGNAVTEKTSRTPAGRSPAKRTASTKEAAAPRKAASPRSKRVVLKKKDSLRSAPGSMRRTVIFAAAALLAALTILGFGADLRTLVFKGVDRASEARNP